MILYLRPRILEILRFKIIRFLGGIPTIPVNNYPYKSEEFRKI